MTNLMNEATRMGIARKQQLIPKRVQHNYRIERLQSFIGDLRLKKIMKDSSPQVIALDSYQGETFVQKLMSLQTKGVITPQSQTV